MSSEVLSGRRVAFYFVAFFGVVAAMDAFMVTSALRTHSGLVTDHAYEKGLAYNEVVKASNAQEKLGWKGELELRHAKNAGAPSTIIFILKDERGAPIAFDRAVATITRPTKQGMDFTLELKGEETPATFPASGVWEMRVDAKTREQHYQQSKRFVVP